MKYDLKDGRGLILYVFLVMVLVIFLSGCQTKETRAQISQTQEAQLTCYDKAIAYQNAQLANAPKLEDDMAKIMYLMMIKDNRNAAFVACAGTMEALLDYHQQRYMANLRATTTLGSFAIGAWAVDSLASTFASNMGSSSTTQITGSRVVSGSGNGSRNSTISASGEGLGQANTFLRSGGNGQQIGGFQPRTNPVQTENIDSNQPQSASGENQGSNPVEVGDEGATIQPFVPEE
jgi:hypothetical protein